MADTPDTGVGDGAESYVDLMRQVHTIYRELERELKRQGFTARQRREEWQPVEAAISGTSETTDDQSGRAVGQAALDAARQVRAKWMPDIDQ